MTDLIILDRDGVINYDSYDYIKSIDEFRLIPESLSAIARLTQAGVTIAIATNQSGISRGYYSAETLEDIHSWLLEQVKDRGGEIAMIEHCPHLPESGCACRKPRPGMLQKIASRFNTALEGVPFVGDRTSDVHAAIAAGAEPHIVRSKMTDSSITNDHPNVPIYPSLSDFVDAYLGR